METERGKKAASKSESENEPSAEGTAHCIDDGTASCAAGGILAYPAAAPGKCYSCKTNRLSRELAERIQNHAKTGVPC